DARDPQGLPERVGLHLRQALHDLARQSRDTVERKIQRNAPPLVSPRPLDLTFLPTKIASVLDRRLGARDVERDRRGISLEPRNPIRREQLGEMNLRLPEQLTGGDAVPRVGFDGRLVERFQIARKTIPPAFEPCP